MRITRLRLAGFGPYRAPQEVDFSRFDADGIFLITGRTGSGKSSILDAVCFALYGDVPRYDGRERQVRSQHCGATDLSEVELDLLVGDAEYRIRRTPKYERVKRTGTGTTTAEPEARLSVREPDGWRPVAVKPKEVAAALSGILPIRKDQFLQVILLAQNRFQEFLLAPTEERRSLLRTLFGTSRFERLELDLLERRRSLGQEVADADREIRLRADTVADLAERESTAEPDVPWFEGAVAAAEAAAAESAGRVAEQRTADADADARFQEAQAVRQRQARRDGARARLAALEAAEPEVAASRARLQAAGRAESAQPQIEAAAAAADDAQAALTEQRAAAAAADLPAGADPASVVDELLTLLGGLERATGLEERLPALRADDESLAGAAAEAEETLRAAEEELSALPARTAEVAEALAAAAAAAGALDGRLAAEREAAAAATAVLEAAALEGTLAQARLEEAAASAANRSAAADYDDLVQRRLRGQSFELAAALAPGEPCPVCGSLEHPRPATTDGDPVTADDLEAARATVQERQQALATAGERAAAVEQQHAVALARAGQNDVALLTERLETARAATALARAAVRRRDELVAERDSLDASAAGLREQVTSRRAARSAAVTRSEAARAALAGAESEVLAARGSFPSVADRTRHLRAELASARRLEQADRAATVTSAALASATAALTAQLAALGFPDRAAALEARLDPAEARRLADRVQAHVEDRAAAAAVLDEPESQDLPEEPVDPQPFREALDAARAVLDAGIAEQSRLAARAEAVRDSAGTAVGLLRRAADRRHEYRALRDLAATVHGEEPNTRRMRLETYVLAAQLEQILAAANLRLGRMTSGRYELELDDERQHRNVETGLGIAVRDAHTGQVRQAASLSGGEMFLASLALALGLAEVVSAESGGVRLDTLFVDEGFGSLDGETLDVAMAALDDLRAGGRTIGLISHVESMQERIPAKLEVEVLPTGDSRVLQRAGS